MSATETGPASQPIIIVRRAAHHEDGHHGGAWKIAFADFMTAMMAFFLVMWLTNVTDEATRKQIAQYFSPIKLNSTSPDAPGLEQIEGQKPTKVEPTATPGEDAKGGDGRPVAGDTVGGKDEAIFRDPYAVLAEIAANDDAKTPDKAGVPDGSGLPGLNGGEAFRDPFDPASWQLQRNAVAADPAATLRPAEFTTLASDPARPPQPVPGADANGTPAAPQVTSLETQVTDVQPAPAAAKADAAAQAAEVAELRSEIAEKLPAAQNPGASGIEVTQGDGGITIALADSVNTGMFEIGSAKPRAETIRMMEAIATILSERRGDIVIRGYTDARPYTGEAYDNWRLSTDRAHMAYYMLARGGLDQMRVDSIEGFGDRKLKDAADPFAAVNRRIEILLKEPKA